VTLLRELDHETGVRPAFIEKRGTRVPLDPLALREDRDSRVEPEQPSAALRREYP
jgi:hypothetical protein